MLPTNLKFGSKVESAPARMIRSNIAPQNGTEKYYLGDIITINIPTRANLVNVPTENYFKFDIVVTNTSGANSTYRWDGSAHSIIQRIRLYSGANLLEDCDNYQLLVKMLYDLQVSTDGAYGKYNVLTGSRNDLVVKSNATANAADVTAVNTIFNNGILSAFQVNSGESLNGNALIADGASTTKITYCLNLVSVMGSLCQKQYFPLFACTSAPLRMEIQLVDKLEKAMLCTGTGTITLTNVEFVANNIELSDSAMGMISQSLQGQPLQFVIPQWRNFGYSYKLVPTNEISVNMPIPAKFSSLKSIFVCARDKGTGTVTFPPLSSVTAGITQYYFRIGPNVFPPKSPTRLPEMFAECMKAIGSISDLNHHPSIEKASYTLNKTITGNAADTLYNNVQSGSFYVGLDLENYSSAPKDSIFAGYNSNTDDIYYVGSYNSPAGVEDVRFDAFATFDCVYVFENNTAFIRF